MTGIKSEYEAHLQKERRDLALAFETAIHDLKVSVKLPNQFFACNSGMLNANELARLPYPFELDCS